MLEILQALDWVKAALVLVVVFGMIILILFRRIVSQELEPVGVAFSVFGLVETAIVTVIKNPIPLLGVALLVVYIGLILALVLIFNEQRIRTDAHIRRVLSDAPLAEGVQHTCETRGEVQRWIEVAKDKIDVDFFPGGFPESSRR